jgi:hypothetical protein
MVCAGDGSRTYVRACLLRGRLRRLSLPPLIPRCSCWATMVWSSGEMIAVQSKISCRRWSVVCQLVRDRHPQRTMLHWWRLLMVQHGRLPEDNAVHALGTDAISQAILSGGLLYPCQAVLSNSNAPTLFRSIAGFDPTDQMGESIQHSPVLDPRGVWTSRSQGYDTHRAQDWRR